MGRHYLLKILISLIVVIAFGYGSYLQLSKTYGLPFIVEILDAHTLSVQPLPYYPLPAGLQAGDSVDLQAQNLDTRYAMMSMLGPSYALPAGQTYELSVWRDRTVLTVPVTTIVLPASNWIRLLYFWNFIASCLIMSGIVMLVLWRGHGRAAVGLTFWSLGALCGSIVSSIPLETYLGSIVLLASSVCFLLSVIGLYVMVESTVRTALSRRSRWLWRGLFIAVLAIGALTSQFVGPVLFIGLGWTELVSRQFQIVWALNSLVPVVMLFVCYRSVDFTRRSQVRWMLWSGALWLAALFLGNVQAAGVVTSFIVAGFVSVLAMLGFLYAVLRHRAVDVSVFIDRTLVYGSVTALVVGILAALNSVVQRAALGTSASLLLQIVVPLALGIVLVPVRNYADKFVERLFFRRKYLAEKALRQFAQRASGYDRADTLLAAAIQLVHDQLDSPGVAMYFRSGDGYTVAGHAGTHIYPTNLNSDDAALTAVRAGAKVVDLSGLSSIVGSDGYIFPMGSQTMLVCANRPGERYSSDERKLLTYFARQVGAALDQLHVKEAMKRLEAKASLVDAVLTGALPASAKLKARARELASIPQLG